MRSKYWDLAVCPYCHRHVPARPTRHNQRVDLFAWGDDVDTVSLMLEATEFAWHRRSMFRRCEGSKDTFLVRERRWLRST